MLFPLPPSGLHLRYREGGASRAEVFYQYLHSKTDQRDTACQFSFLPELRPDPSASYVSARAQHAGHPAYHKARDRYRHTE